MWSANLSALSVAPPARAGRFAAWTRRGLRAACLALALLPAAFIAGEVLAWVRNIPHWDEFDTVLDLLLALEASPGAGRVGELLLAPNNEHRMLVSRLLFALSYWVTGGVNFAALAVIGNLFIVGAVALLAWSARGQAARWRLATVLGALVFQLQHHENFFWGGSSIDHFLVVLAAVAAFRALDRGGRLALAGGIAAGAAATFSLAHGLLVWPLGAALLAAQRRGRALAIWSAAAAAGAVLYFQGFAFNPGTPPPRPRRSARRGRAGSHAARRRTRTRPPRPRPLPRRRPARHPGAARPARPRPPRAARSRRRRVGRRRPRPRRLGPHADHGPLGAAHLALLHLSALAWALVLWVGWERLVRRHGAGSLVVAPVLAALLAFNVAASAAHDGVGRSFARTAERGAWNYHRDGTFALSPPILYPDPARADGLVRACADRGLYRLPRAATLTLAEPTLVSLADSTEIADAAYYIESIRSVADSVVIHGWAFRRQHRLREGDIAVLFRSSAGLLACEATPLHRPDVAREFRRPDATYSGFRVRVPRASLPADRLQIGVGFDLDGDPEHMMTAHTVENLLQ
jgi:hypothetical protein